MGVWPKMPTAGIHCLKSVFAQNLVVGSRCCVRIDIIVAPIMAVLYLFKMVVTVKKHMTHAPRFEVKVKLPDSIVPRLCAGGPIYIDHELAILVTMAVRHFIYARCIDLIIFAIDQPLFTLPCAPLYHNQDIAPDITVRFDPTTRGAHDAMVAAGRF